MSKRKVTFGENVEFKVPETKSRRFKEDHSLDSDEDDDEKTKKTAAENDEERLDDEDIEGQEDETIRFDGDIPVTPFNLKEEMEEGHFDSQGTYIANKDSDAVHDGWLDSVDWKNVDNLKKITEQKDEDNLDVTDLQMTEKDISIVMKQMSDLLKPGETVLKGIRRLGGGNNKPQNKRPRQWQKKKAEVSVDVTMKDDEGSQIENKDGNKDNMLNLTSLADKLLQNGDFEIYEKTYEKLKHQVKTFESQFADAEEDDELEAAFSEGKENESKKPIAAPKIDDEVNWEYKWNGDEGSEVFGPYPTTQMVDWQSQGFFTETVLCRKIGSEGNFYSIKRMDFDLYL